MKISASILIMLIPIVAAAQNYQGMNEGDMQKMMEQMQKMESCMQNVDQEELKVIEKRSYQVEDEVKALCAVGKRDEAQNKAIAFGEEVAKSPALQAMRKCGEMMPRMPKMPFTDEDHDYSSDHVCDE